MVRRKTIKRMSILESIKKKYKTKSKSKSTDDIALELIARGAKPF